MLHPTWVRQWWLSTPSRPLPSKCSTLSLPPPICPEWGNLPLLDEFDTIATLQHPLWQHRLPGKHLQPHRLDYLQWCLTVGYVEGTQEAGRSPQIRRSERLCSDQHWAQYNTCVGPWCLRYSRVTVAEPSAVSVSLWLVSCKGEPQREANSCHDQAGACHSSLSCPVPSGGRSVITQVSCCEAPGGVPVDVHTRSCS
jgi:hypothetical protein